MYWASDIERGKPANSEDKFDTMTSIHLMNLTGDAAATRCQLSWRDLDAEGTSADFAGAVPRARGSTCPPVTPVAQVRVREEALLISTVLNLKRLAKVLVRWPASP